jgi:hypothetical protein
MSPEFALACAGYLRLETAHLPAMLRALPSPVSERERAVVAAIRWRLEHEQRRRA